MYVGNDLISGVTTETSLVEERHDSWNFHKESTGGTKLSVEVAGYDNWMPEAAASKVETDVGNVLTFKASLIEGDGTTSCAQADSFKFELTDVSHETGIALNFPEALKAGKDYDLHFKQEYNSPDDIMSSDRLTLLTQGGRYATATVASFDWGAYGTLKVTAYIKGRSPITGYLEGHPEITDILIPKRSSGSKIADKWKKVKDVEGLADADDSENEPVGNKNTGDGFTLYEEYRGFYVKGKHINGDPKTKDLFVFSDLDDFLPGIQLFKGVTGLNIYYQLYASEFDTTQRVMNFNYSEPTLHIVDQHGLRIKQTINDESQTSDLHGKNVVGTPKNVVSINISQKAYRFTTIIRRSRKEITSELNVTVAHELCHGIHIYHHGEGDPKYRMWSSSSFENFATGKLENEYFESGNHIIPKFENGRLFTKTLSEATKVYVAVWEGQHSGFEDCIMRYDIADAYIPDPGATSDIRYVVRGDERTGIKLCDKKEDDQGGVNYLERTVNGKKRCRYGSAVKGACVYQICVSDKYY